MSVAAEQNSRPPSALRRSATPARGANATIAVGALFAAVLAWTFALRSPFLSVEGSDDAFFVAVANLWAHGVLPYAGAFDVKPPGFFAILAVAQALLGASLRSLAVVTIVFDAVTATALFHLGARMGSRGIGVFAALLYPLLSLVVTNNAPYAPLAAFTTLAFLAAMSRLPILGRAALAGLLIGVAATIKQTAAFEALALLVILLWTPDAALRRPSAAAAFILGAAAPALAFLAYFAAQGAAGPMIEDVVVGALRRPASSVEGVTLLEGFLRSLTLLMRPIEPLAILACFALLRRPAIEAEFSRASLKPIGAWTAAALVSVWAQRALFEAYMGPMLAPLLLLAGAAVAFAPAWLRRVAAPARLAVAGLVVVAAALFSRTPGLDMREEPGAVARAAEAIKGSDPAPDDRLLVVSRGAWLYPATGLAPPTAYFHWEHTLSDFPGAGPARLAEALATTPRYLVVADRGRHAKTELAESWRLIDAALARSYRLLAHVQGIGDSYDVYAATPTQAAR
ncbi:MAG: glycosyltransferase family 39 protein [Roseiarcus sp.]